MRGRFRIARRGVALRCAIAFGALAQLVPAVAGAQESYRLALEPSTAPVVPRYVPFVLLLVLEVVAILTAVLVLSRRPASPGAPLLCSRCARLHARTEAFARVADAAAVGALAFLVALPFVAAGYETGFTLPGTVLAISAVVAVVALAAEADFLVRALAARLLPQFTWSAEPGRIIGGGARWLGVIFALYLFEPRSAGIAALFGGVGRRLMLDLTSTWTIFAAAAILVFTLIVALLTRWLAPLIFGSLPLTARKPHGTSA
jgi:hypothetical protein